MRESSHEYSSRVEALAILHGFLSCSYDHRQSLACLAEARRVVVHDHLGFGLSDKPIGDSHSLLERADYALGLWMALGISKVHVLAHGYGTSVATESLARRERGLLPIELASVTLCNGSMLIDMVRLTLSSWICDSQLVWLEERGLIRSTKTTIVLETVKESSVLSLPRLGAP